jgi:hypothetical protein
MGKDVWNKPPPSSAVTERLSQPLAFHNYSFLNLLASCDFSSLEGPAAHLQRRLAVVFRGHKWPIFVCEVDPIGDAFRLALFHEPPDTHYGGHYGGSFSGFAADEWRIVFAEAQEAALVSGASLSVQDAEGRGWLAVSGPASGLPDDDRTGAEIRALRQGCMDRMSAAFGVVWPEGWLDRHAVAAEHAERPVAREPRRSLRAYRMDRPERELGREAVAGMARRAPASNAENARARRFWAEYVSRPVPGYVPPVPFPRVIDPLREWAVRYLPPSPVELAKAEATIAEVRALQDELSPAFASPKGPPGRSRPGGPWRE